MSDMSLQPVPRPLAGIRLLDLSSLDMGPFATQTLGDLGADVIKLEAPGGDVFRHVVPQRSPGMSHTFIQFNRNKRSVAIDLKTELGREAQERLVKSADVLVITMRAEAARKLGLDYDSVRAINPGIVYCVAYGYSDRGPYAGRLRTRRQQGPPPVPDQGRLAGSDPLRNTAMAALLPADRPHGPGRYAGDGRSRLP